MLPREDDTTYTIRFIFSCNYNAINVHAETSAWPTPAVWREQMETKTARLTVLIDPAKKKAFEDLCASQDLTPSQVVRQLIRDYLAKHGVTYGKAARRTNPKVS